MANTASPANVACLNCIDEQQLWISRNDGVDWFEVPTATQIQLQANRENATTIKFQGVSTAVCSATSKSWTYLVTLWICLTAHWRNYFADGDTFWAAFVNGDDLTTDPYEMAEVTLDFDGYTRNDQGNTPEQNVLRLNVVSDIYFQNFVEAAAKPPQAGTIDTTPPAAPAGAAIPG